jgi:hypothetical protein
MSGVAVYLMTSSDDPRHKRQAEADGVTEYLIKSPVTDDLVAKLDLLIAQINARQGTHAFPGHGRAIAVPQGLTSFPQPEAFLRSHKKSSR